MTPGLLLALTLLAAAGPGEPSDPFPGAAASYLVAVDGRVLWEHAADAPRQSASLAKMMAALVLLEKDWRPGSVVTVSAKGAAAGGTRLGLRTGDRMRAGDLLTAMLVRSANDACLALAESAAGSAEAFVREMNARASALGLTDTSFVDPCGFDRPGQRSTARDLWRLAEAALANPVFAETVALSRAEVRTLSGRSFEITSSNALLGRLPGAKGVKTGYTRKAGKCLVALAERDGVRVVLVLLDAPDRWWTAAGIVEKAFEAARASR